MAAAVVRGLSLWPCEALSGAAGLSSGRGDWFPPERVICSVFCDCTPEATRYFFSVLLVTQVSLGSTKGMDMGVEGHSGPATGLLAYLCLKVLTLENFWGLFKA